MLRQITKLFQMNQFHKSALIIGLFSLMLIAACTPTRFVKPLEKDQSAIGFNAGGPLIHFAGTKIPVPFSSIYYGYGVSDKGTASIGFHTTALIYENLQLDLGYTHQILEQENYIPGISLTPSSQFILGFRENDFRFYPAVDLNAFYEYGQMKHMSYVSFNNWFDPHPGKVKASNDYSAWRPSIALGHIYRINSWEIGLEYKYLGFNLDNTKTVVNYVNNIETGAHGIYLQFSKKF